MSDQNNDQERPSERTKHLGAVIAAFLEAIRNGETPDREELLQKHPDIRAELASFFEIHSQMSGTPAMGVAESSQAADEQSVPAPLFSVSKDGEHERERTSPQDGGESKNHVVLVTLIIVGSICTLDLLVDVIAWIGWTSFITSVLWLAIAVLALGAVVTGFAASETKDSEERAGLWVVCGGCVVVAAIAWWLIPSNEESPASGPDVPPTTAEPTIPEPSSDPSVSLSSKQLRLTSVTIWGYWKENDAFEDDISTWSGSALVYGRSESMLLLYTNSHVLNLGLLAASDPVDPPPEVSRYSLVVEFPSGVKKAATFIAEETTDLDLGLIGVSANGLVEGTDYVIVPYSKSFQPKVGDRVVAVGNPLGGFPGTHTYGRVGAIRKRGLRGEVCEHIQHDAAVNRGNSGGPLFCQESDGRMVWSGINTWGAAEGVKLAISSHEAVSAKYIWAPCNSEGAAQLIRRMYGVQATVEP